MLKGVLIKPMLAIPENHSKDFIANNVAAMVEISGDLDSLYRVLDVDTIDIVVRKIGDNHFDIVCDDEGLFKDPVLPSMLTRKGEALLVGNLFVCHHDEQGNLTSLTDDEAKMIRDHICRYKIRGDGLYYAVHGEYN